MNIAPNINDLLVTLIAMQGKNNKKIAQYETRIAQLEHIIQSEILPRLSAQTST
ncbi:hypothetical protein [Niallia sp. 01092]|uniref:hypothetical protein n=1 Tax=unclassified Niallia TaxID=2837522 RepID=UPI003FCF7D0B